MKNRFSPAYDQAQSIIKYLNSTRGVGHTFAVLNGATSSKAIVVFADHNQADNMADLFPFNTRMALGELPAKLHGIRSPLLIDNYTLSVLLDNLLKEIEIRDTEIKNKTIILQRVQTIIDSELNP